MQCKLTLINFSVMALLALTSCKKDDHLDPGTNKHSDAKGTYLNESTTWYLTREGSGGTVHVKFSGKTNADSVKIVTAGDGLASEVKITLSSMKTFSEDVPVSFSHGAVQTGTFTSSATLKAYKEGDILIVTLKSGSLSY
jgi:hypothetical protein